MITAAPPRLRQLFGHEKGAFTDARPAKAGLFPAAHGGTLFLDEVGLLPVARQGKLLKAVEERTVRRLGSTRHPSVRRVACACSFLIA